MIAVMSIDGKITRWEDSQDVSIWASAEDQEFFVSMIRKHKVLVMGRKSYDAVKGKLKIEDGRLRIVMTSSPEKYRNDEISGKLAFTNETPQELVNRLEKEGHTELLLLGGSAIYTSFLKANLVTDLYLTIEPKIFGEGKMLVDEERFNIDLKLHSMKQVNSNGTVVLHYT